MPFIHRVVRHVASESHKVHTKEISLEKIAEPSARQLKDSNEDLVIDGRLRCLGQCAHSLSRQDRELIFEYCRYDKSQRIENKRKMAQALGITTGALGVPRTAATGELRDRLHEGRFRQMKRFQPKTTSSIGGTRVV
jgi:hypothetical protein